MAAFLAMVHAVNDVLTAILGALLPTLQAPAMTLIFAFLVPAAVIASRELARR
jgi:FSR family fosmidomycin resistance protein-like MFS transporter